MNSPLQYTRDLLAMTDVDLEKFAYTFLTKKPQYKEVKSLTGAGDRGRDVVAYLTDKRDEGDWHNYQCKQYGGSLPTETAIADIGKMLYYSFRGEFILPSKYYFVAPRGVNRTFRKHLLNPKQFKIDFLDELWDKYCKANIIKDTEIKLTAKLRAFINKWDFNNINWIDKNEILTDSDCKAVLFEWFGADPGPPPRGQVPAAIHSNESVYIKALLDAYSERESHTFVSTSDLSGFPEHEQDFGRHRERFFDAEAFSVFYRDNTYVKETETFKNDVYLGIIDTRNNEHKDCLARINAVMIQAAKINAGGVLAKHAGVTVKQGMCHHFVNENKIKWTK